MKNDNNYLQIWFYSLLVGVATFSIGAYGVDSTSKITKIKSYIEYGAGDILVYVENPVPGCDVYWVDGDAVGSKNALSILLSAKALNVPITAGVLVGQEWAGAPGSPYCRIITVSY